MPVVDASMTAEPAKVPTKASTPETDKATSILTENLETLSVTEPVSDVYRAPTSTPTERTRTPVDPIPTNNISGEDTPIAEAPMEKALMVEAPVSNTTADATLVNPLDAWTLTVNNLAADAPVVEVPIVQAPVADVPILDAAIFDTPGTGITMNAAPIADIGIANSTANVASVADTTTSNVPVADVTVAESQPIGSTVPVSNDEVPETTVATTIQFTEYELEDAELNRLIFGEIPPWNCELDRLMDQMDQARDAAERIEGTPMNVDRAGVGPVEGHEVAGSEDKL
ncbi:hypothetical protein M501DRAFT_1013384 [Patellaria atrata CBS 101060]|uniref:Uncharacterized protein n=1 Tax=Patellaria atrata CBS 101060 TaxID=1346257 RepID=A0A9P4SHQ5_9PEZI|nr:hypothetical protein M501DRAFT_1013384 [Patellaria atrata CBS 101060]